MKHALVHVHCYHSAKEEDRIYAELASIYEKGLFARLWHVVMPASTGAIFTAVRLSIALGWVVVAFSEYNMQETGRGGIGMYILQSNSLGKIEEKFAGMAILGISGALIDWSLTLLERQLRNWADDTGHTI
jgi:ABC-type nitrate/sulfonate/bicarbonate transport system permease component